MNSQGSAEFVAGLVIGGVVGAALTLLLAPQPGAETRAQLRDKSLELKEQAEEGLLEASRVAKEQAVILQEKGQDTLERGKQSAGAAIERVKSSVVPNRPSSPEEVSAAGESQ